jgi:hypothetical protein
VVRWRVTAKLVAIFPVGIAALKRTRFGRC